MSAYLLVVINTKTLKVEDAMIASQGAGSMSCAPRDCIYSELYSYSEPVPTNPSEWMHPYEREQLNILKVLDYEFSPWKFVIPFLARRWNAMHREFALGRERAWAGDPQALAIVQKLSPTLELEMKLFRDAETPMLPAPERRSSESG